jgi:hypothetical protein
MEALVAAGYPSKRDSSGNYYEGIDLYDANASPVEDDLWLVTRAIELVQRKDRAEAMKLIGKIIDSDAIDAARIAVEAILRPLVTPVPAPVPAGCSDDEAELWPDVPDPAETIQRLQARNGSHS